MFGIEKPEVTTVIRWFLRVILVVFLAWLVRQRPEQEEEEEEPEENEDDMAESKHRANALRPRNASARSVARLQPRRDPYAQTNPRPRRTAGENSSTDFDSIIDKMSKPKEMWEVRKSGEPMQILRKSGSGIPQENGDSSGVSTAAPGDDSLRSSAAPKLTLKPPKNREKNDKEKSLHGHERPVTFITFNQEGNLIFTCSKDKTVCVWSFPDGEQLGSYKGHNGAVWSCSPSVDSRWLVTCGADRLVIVWEARESRELARVELPGVVRCVEWAGAAPGASSTPGLERFVTCNNRFGAHPPTIAVWRFDGTVIEELMKITTLPSAALQVRWGRADYFVVSAHENGELIFWRADKGEEVKRLKAQDAGISQFHFSACREMVATVSHDMTVMVWDLGKGVDWRMLYHVKVDRPLNTVALGPITRAASVGAPADRPKGCTVIAAGGQDARDVAISSGCSEQFGTLLFKLGEEENLPCELKADGVTKGHFGPVHTLAFARDGSAVASGSEDGCVRITMF
eukprot:TRINITY_DN79893_c0_g1_i1.p1 TRINITY_DN79893_c0_g1~~TRINITY_DN79893_c0_g1_i1.p1  ORF type:complete len:514 (-),score=99.44 TRINITY_DN79893_c0_g1_i1:78-1619(-)